MRSEILMIKVGGVETLTFSDGSTLETAIRKRPVPMVKVHQLGAEGNEVGLTAHHGGVDKALFFMSDESFQKLTALINKEFDYQGIAIYGENFVVSGWNEENVCVGDRYQIGTAIVEVSQPRKPCDRLSKNTGNKDTHHVVRHSGLSGWYVRVLQEGEIKTLDLVQRIQCPYPNLTIKHLNKLLSGSEKELTREELELAINCDALAEAFKRSLRNQLQRVEKASKS
ncbi:MOSC domain-containing protein [Pasteurella sp. P03HT]